MRFFSLTSATGIIIVMFLSAYFLTREYETFLFTAQSREIQSNHLRNATVGTPAAYRSKVNTLEICDRTISSGTFGFFVSEDRAKIRATCLDLARDMLVKSPDLAYAHYVSALAMSDEPTNPEFRGSLDAAVTYAPYVGWQAALRLNLATKVFDRAPNTAQRVIENDVQSVIRSKVGQTILARIYRRHADTEGGAWDAIANQIEVAPSDLQRAFLRTLRQQEQN